jgi:hypothetical protein
MSVKARCHCCGGISAYSVFGYIIPFFFFWVRYNLKLEKQELKKRGTIE